MRAVIGRPGRSRAVRVIDCYAISRRNTLCKAGWPYMIKPMRVDPAIWPVIIAVWSICIRMMMTFMTIIIWPEQQVSNSVLLL